MNITDEERYAEYVAYCNRLGIPPATYEHWDKVTRWIGELRGCL